MQVATEADAAVALAHPNPTPQSAFVVHVAATHRPTTTPHSQIDPAPQSESCRHP